MPRPDGSKEQATCGIAFAVDLGGTHLRAALVEQSGRIRFRLKERTPRTADGNDIAQAILEAAQRCRQQVDGEKICAAAIAVPGTVDVAEGVVLTAPNLSSLNGFHLGATLENTLKLPVTLENDANAATVGEVWQGAARGHHSVVCLTLGTGVGGGIILDDRLWCGADGSAGEIGHMAIEPFAGPVCGCGGRGCLEVYASATAIGRMTRELLPQYPASVIPPDSSAQEVYSAGLRGDELALEVFRRMGVHLGVGLANLINILNPEMIVLAGGVANGWQLFEKYMRQEVAGRAFPLPAARVQIVQGQCGDDAGMLGVAHLAFVKGE